MLSRRAAQYLRFRRHKSHVTRNEALKLISESQSLPLTQKEVSTRRMTGARFWSSENFVTTSFDPCAGPTALEAAAMICSLQILDLILDAHPDVSWWPADSSTCSIPVFPLQSFLSTSTPIHAAIEAGNNNILMSLHLIDDVPCPESSRRFVATELYAVNQRLGLGWKQPDALRRWREVNEDLQRMLRSMDGGEDVWLNQKNMWGWTPRDLYEDGRHAVAELYKPFWGC
ncbi:hypothetical protein JMJ35_007049 [Cladonia borealis]|uniref:Uncharacterized protein n=1 Tax=Cladonia borealis TaxID=184061 RepID=A0AA39QWN0_9LECA|nr:hypothetical protein JMJ35_007049 [Cladonia borealis]